MLPFDEEQQSFNKSPLDEETLLSGQFWGELRVFLAVAKTKSFNRAAEITNTSQPTVSRQVKRLQDAVGSQLFISTPRGVKLTQKGRGARAGPVTARSHALFITSDLKAETAKRKAPCASASRTAERTVRRALACAVFRPISENSTASEKPAQHHGPAGKPNRHDDRLSPERSHPTSGSESSGSFISFRSSRRTISGNTACRRATIWNSIFSCNRNIISPEPGSGTVGSKRRRADASRTTATIPSPTACW